MNSEEWMPVSRNELGPCVLCLRVRSCAGNRCCFVRFETTRLLSALSAFVFCSLRIVQHDVRSLQHLSLFMYCSACQSD